MVANQMMQVLLDKIDMEGIIASKEYPIAENRSMKGKPYWGAGYFYGRFRAGRKISGKGLTDLEWSGNKIYVEISREIDALLKEGLGILKQWKIQLATDFPQYEFDIILSIDYGDEDVPPSAVIRFYCIRNHYRIVERDHQNINQFVQPILIESVGGTGIYSNDVSQEVRDSYIELLEEGISNEEAMGRIFEKFENYLQDDIYRYDFWFALADTQSSIGRLHPKVKEFARMLIEEGGDVQRWVQHSNQRGNRSGNHPGKRRGNRDGGWNGVLERQKILNQLKAKLLDPQPAEKKIERRPVFRCPWRMGDLFAYRLENKTAVKNGLAGRYVIIQKVKEIKWERGSTMPMVLFRMSATDQLPGVEEATDLEIIKTIDLEFKDRIHKDVTVLESESLSSIPSRLIFLGNSRKGLEEFDVIKADILEYRYSTWETLEDNVIRDYNLMKKYSNSSVV